MRGAGRRPTVVLAGATLLLASASPAFAQLGGSGSLSEPLRDTTRDVVDTTTDTVDDVTGTVDDLVDDVTDDLPDPLSDLDDDLLDDLLEDVLAEGDEDDDVVEEEADVEEEPAPVAPRDTSRLRAWLGEDHGLGGVPYDPNVVRAIPVHERGETGAVAIAGDPSAAVTERPVTRVVLVALIVLVAGVLGLGVGRWLSGLRAGQGR